MVVWWVGAGCWGGAVHTWGRGRGCLQGDRREIRCRLSARCPAHRRILEGRRLFARCPTAGSRKVSLIRKVSSPPQDARMCRLSARCPAAGCSNALLLLCFFCLCRLSARFPARRYVWEPFNLFICLFCCWPRRQTVCFHVICMNLGVSS